jgi:hypothetical protein
MKHLSRERKRATWLLLMTKRSARCNNVFIRKVEGIDVKKVIDTFLRYLVANAPKEDTVQSISQQVAVQ